MDRPNAVEAALARLPLYPSVTDLLEGFGSKDALLDAYVQGWLPPEIEQTLEADFLRLQCWLLARLLRLHLQP